jgi:hypothetical protein
MGFFSDIADTIRELAAQQEAQNGDIKNARDAVNGVIDYIPVQKVPEPREPIRGTLPEPITYTYKQGDNFAKVLVDLGLSDGTNLWGEDGDVKYYESQLKNQGIDGNIPVGTTFNLLPRGAVEEFNKLNGINTNPNDGWIESLVEGREFLNNLPRDGGRRNGQWKDTFFSDPSPRYTYPAGRYVQNPGVNTRGLYAQPPAGINPAGRYVQDTFRPRMPQQGGNTRVWEDDVLDYLGRRNSQYNTYDVIQDFIDGLYYRAAERGLITPDEYRASGAVVDDIVAGRRQPRVLRRK